MDRDTKEQRTLCSATIFPLSRKPSLVRCGHSLSAAFKPDHTKTSLVALRQASRHGKACCRNTNDTFVLATRGADGPTNSFYASGHCSCRIPAPAASFANRDHEIAPLRTLKHDVRRPMQAAKQPPCAMVRDKVSPRDLDLVLTIGLVDLLGGLGDSVRSGERRGVARGRARSSVPGGAGRTGG